MEAALEALVPGARVAGLVGPGSVEVISLQWMGSNFVELTVRDEWGHTSQAMVPREQAARLRIENAGPASAFDADAMEWRLAAEALRIRYAALHDPMLAVATSNMRALPHQLTAVYGELLPRTPLRFLLADDPGAGKTIMAGLYIKELMLRGDLARCLIVAPGSLVEQWQDELNDKFGLVFTVLTRELMDAAPVGTNVFEAHPLLIARMDQLSRALSREDPLAAGLTSSDWDLVVVDEAHRMSAHYYGGELKATQRYELGRQLGAITRHFLLMTATPHAGKPEDFQLFLALLDGDRFEGRYRDGVHSSQPGDLMRRMIKEDLLTMEGKPLFPERRATTVPYELSPLEKDLYEVVTAYVREEMGKADELAEGEGRRRNNVGFALTVLQRRLASSPEAILRSLERRRERLQKKLRQLDQGETWSDSRLSDRLTVLLGQDAETIDDELDDLDAAEVEELEQEVVDSATAARTRAQLEAEIAVLAQLVEVAQRVRHSGTDRKWTELRQILNDQSLAGDVTSGPRKLIVFTEHRDTLSYLVDQIGSFLGDPAAVVAIHGGVRREERRNVTEVFTTDPSVRVLVATDAAGEGLNLQRAHLMVNYDLPWNPNKIEQRFGRIHRIGQTEVCHLWNLVASDTREGEVFLRLLAKVEEQREAYGGKVFDVLGEAFEGRPLRELLVQAIRYGNQPEVRARLDQVIDESVVDGIPELLAERALHREVLAEAEVAELQRRIEEAQARRLQPHYLRSFFMAAFDRLGGRIVRRESGRYEVTHVPQRVRDRDRQSGSGAAVVARYERVCFEREQMRLADLPPAQLLAPGHPLMDSVVDLTWMDLASTLKHGTVLLDPNDSSEQARLLVALSEEISDGHAQRRTVSKQFSFVEIDGAGAAHGSGPAPYLDYQPLPSGMDELVSEQLREPWLARGVEKTALAWAADHSLAGHLADVQARTSAAVARARAQVRARLMGEINYWDAEHNRLLDLQGAGKKLRMSPDTAARRARDLEHRLAQRMASLDADEQLIASPPLILGAAVVLPAGLLAAQGDGEPEALPTRNTAEVERRAVDAVLAAERALGAVPEEMPHNNPGYDVRSVHPDGTVMYIEVKGRIDGSADFFITKNEVVTAKNLGDRYRLALVRVSKESAEHDEVRYIASPFDGLDTDDFRVNGFRMNWVRIWNS